MKFNSDFSGRIIQVTDALDFGDAVSNQIIALDRLFERMGFNSAIFSKWHHEQVAEHRQDLDELDAGEGDIVILHFYGFSEFALPAVLERYTTRVMVYHNITPEQYFDENSPTYAFCRQGRAQLKENWGKFQQFWGVSHYNLREIEALGVSRRQCHLVPIVVDPVEDFESVRADGSWLFVGRLAPNKRQLDLIKLFEAAKKAYPESAQHLYLVGSYATDDEYVTRMREYISDHGLSDFVTLTGKVSDEEREAYYRRSRLFVSLSDHEGFGVPLIEASLRGLPVVALDTSAVGETMGNGQGLEKNEKQLLELIAKVSADATLVSLLLTEQQVNAQRFSSDAVCANLSDALRSLLPFSRQFRKVSVVICTYNRRDYLERVFDYLQYQTNPAFEVIVVDGPSDDGTRELLVERAQAVKVAFNDQRNLSISRNIGIELADGEIVAFIDDDALPFNDWIDRILEAYNERPLTTAGLGGPAYYAGTFWFQAEDNGINCLGEAKVNIPSEQIGREGWFRYNTGTNATFVTKVIRESGGFDEQFDYYLDESEVCYRLQCAGYLIGYVPGVVVRHEFAQSHNRQGKLNYNWFTICKNTAYFVAAYSGLQGRELQAYLVERMRRERIQPIEDAFANGSIDEAEKNRHIQAILDGTRQGIEDSKSYPRRRVLGSVRRGFHPYPVVYGKPPRPLHICIISREFPPFAAGGGVGTLYYHLASELLLMGHRVTVIVPSTEPHTFQQGNIVVHFTSQSDELLKDVDQGFSRNISWSVSAMSELSKIHKEYPVDIVDSSLWDTEALAVALLPKHKRPKVVVRLVTPYALASQINGWRPDKKTEALFMGAERALIGAADAVVPISASIANSIQAIYGVTRDERWVQIPCGIAYWPYFDVNQGYNEFPQLLEIPSSVFTSSKIILFLGRLERRKGVDLIMEAARQFLVADPLAHLILAGRDLEGWRNCTLDSAIKSRVHFVGEVDNGTREKLLARAYCVIFPSRYESFGLVPLEAFVHGVPVIAARAGAVPEVVLDDKCGLLFDSESSAELACSIIRLLQDVNLHQKLSEGAFRRVRELSSRASANCCTDLYISLLEN